MATIATQAVTPIITGKLSSIANLLCENRVWERPHVPSLDHVSGDAAEKLAAGKSRAREEAVATFSFRARCDKRARNEEPRHVSARGYAAALNFRARSCRTR